jgi:hypothetical protein
MRPAENASPSWRGRRSSWRPSASAGAASALLADRAIAEVLASARQLESGGRQEQPDPA